MVLKNLPWVYLSSRKKMEKFIYHKAFGNYEYDTDARQWRLAAYLTWHRLKISVTLAIMKLFEEGKIDLKKISWPLHG